MKVIGGVRWAGYGRRAAVLDALLWAALALPVLAGLPGGAAAVAQLAGLVAVGVAIAAARDRPLPFLLLTAALTAVSGNFAFGIPIAAYLTGRRTDDTRPVLWGFIALCAGGAVLNTARGTDVTTWFPVTVYLVLLGVLPWLVGRYWRQYQQLAQAGWERAERLEREQRIVAERERLRERSRIAQDMHDSLGHELSLIALRAGALEVSSELAGRHRAAAGEVRAAATAATERLQQIIGVLREDTAGAPLEPAGESVSALIDRARAWGMLVESYCAGAGDGVPPVVERAVYRIVQEALTNATKHAPGTLVTVQITHGPGETVVAVANPLPASRPSPAGGTAGGPGGEPAGGPDGGPGGGHGLAGLRERARLTGGALTAGPEPGGGFVVRARLPHTPRPAPAGTETESAVRLARARRRVRRDLITAIVAPAVLLVVLGAVMVGYYIQATLTSVLSPADYARLTVGQAQPEAERLLPARQLWGGPATYDTPVPTGAACRYYRSDANLLGVGAVHRVCFAGGRLVAKDTLWPRSATSGED
ncbi:hypothetical protein DPM19_17235 [Actinomadura craniellae]|uniref:histidine kinase n=1 Tax=Actinomadura craniellae TaxID=2231787 RepID=A0A365H4U2_9ACTN|nr:histidine kinase [Actinomadura craniellae]RAY14026.1 hypothetical protein DPM19_17235 [Actinomadura craniellae]